MRKRPSMTRKKVATHGSITLRARWGTRSESVARPRQDNHRRLFVERAMVGYPNAKNIYRRDRTGHRHRFLCRICAGDARSAYAKGEPRRTQQKSKGSCRDVA